MEAFPMLREGEEIEVSSLLACRFPVECGSEAYAEIRNRKAYTVILITGAHERRQKGEPDRRWLLDEE